MKPTTDCRRQFASDNYAGICPEAWASLAQANEGHVRGYGDDPWTERATNLIREVFEYAHRFMGSVFVFRIGARLMDIPSFTGLVSDLALLHENGIKIILVPSGGARIDADRPLISCSVYPYILWAEAFQLSIMPSSVLLKIASYEFSTMVARRAWASSARFRAVISNTAIRNFAKAPASSVSGVLTSCA